MKIRAANPQDIPRVLEIWNPYIRDSVATFNSVEHTADTLAALMRDKAEQGCAFLVAELDGDISGFAYYGQFRGGIGYRHTYEHTVYIAPSAKVAGIGRRLLSEIEDHARARSAHSIFAGVSAENTAGVAFHLRMGYVEVAQLPQVGWKFDRWHDLVLLQKIL